MTALELFMDEPVRVVQQMKICNKCREMLPATPDYFHRRSVSGDGLRTVCKECCNKWTKAYSQNGGYEKQHKINHEKSPHRTALKCLRARVKGYGKRKWLLGDARTPEAEAYIEYLKTITHCPDCAKELVWFSEGKNNLDSASFDRMDSDGDYTKKNVRIVCRHCNQRKNDSPTDEWVGQLEVRIKKGIIEEVDPMLTEFLICE
jgi:hypothetical protein